MNWAAELGLENNALRIEDIDILPFLSRINSLFCAREDVNGLDVDGFPPLHSALTRREHSPEIVQHLLEQGADPNIRNRRGNTPLQEQKFYWRAKSVEIVNLLLDHGADVKLRDRDGRATVILAYKYASLPVFEAVLMRCPADIINWPEVTGERQTVLAAAVRLCLSYGCLEKMRLLFRVCARHVDLRGIPGNEGLLFSAVKDFCGLCSLEVSLLLLEYNIDPNVRDSKGATVLYHAVSEYYKLCLSGFAREEFLVLIQQLLKAGASVELFPSFHLLNYALCVCPDNLEDCPVLKLSVKHTLQQAFDEDFRNLLVPRAHDKFSNLVWLVQYYQACVQEILKMKSVTLEKGCSLFDFSSRVSLKLSVSKLAGEALHAFDQDSFAIYEDVIMSYFSEGVLLRLMQEQDIRMGKDGIWLIVDCMLKITSFLQKDDILNLFSASFLPSSDGCMSVKRSCDGGMHAAKRKKK